MGGGIMRGIALSLCLWSALAAQAAEKPKHSVDFILQAVMSFMKVEARESVPLPKVFFESETPLSQFQEAIKDQWGLIPEAFSNAFSISKNKIYISDDSEYYQKLKRTIDDSIAHELAHYVQHHYQNYDLLTDPSAEILAIDVQNWFRETYMKN